MCSFGYALAKLWIEAILHKLRFSDPSPLDVSFYKPSLDRYSTNPEMISETLLRLSNEIMFDKIINIGTRNFSGHVYDLQVEPSQIYICNGVIVKNCTCIISSFYKERDMSLTVDNEAAIEHLQGLSKDEQVALMGVSGYEQFKDNPGAWRDAMGYEAEVEKKPQIKLQTDLSN
jgi:hypothetical protein